MSLRSYRASAPRPLYSMGRYCSYFEALPHWNVASQIRHMATYAGTLYSWLVGCVLRPINSEIISRRHPHLLSLAKDVKLGFYTVPTGNRTPGRRVAVHYTTAAPRQLHTLYNVVGISTRFPLILDFKTKYHNKTQTTRQRHIDGFGISYTRIQIITHLDWFTYVLKPARHV